MKLVREHINEKFTEEGDPIEDLGIGIRDLLKKEYEKLSSISLLNIYDKYYSDLKITSYEFAPEFAALFLKNLIKKLFNIKNRLQHSQEIFDDEIAQFNRAAHFAGSIKVKKVIKRTAEIINNKFGIKLKV